MSRSVGALLIAALVPFALALVPVITLIAMALKPVFYLSCLASASAWCALFAYCYGRAGVQGRRRLLWLLPLLFFPSVWPALYTFSWLGLLDHLDRIPL